MFFECQVKSFGWGGRGWGRVESGEEGVIYLHGANTAWGAQLEPSREINPGPRYGAYLRAVPRMRSAFHHFYVWH